MRASRFFLSPSESESFILAFRLAILADCLLPVGLGGLTGLARGPRVDNSIVLRFTEVCNLLRVILPCIIVMAFMILVMTGSCWMASVWDILLCLSCSAREILSILGLGIGEFAASLGSAWHTRGILRGILWRNLWVRLAAWRCCRGRCVCLGGSRGLDTFE